MSVQRRHPLPWRVGHYSPSSDVLDANGLLVAKAATPADAIEFVREANSSVFTITKPEPTLLFRFIVNQNVPPNIAIVVGSDGKPMVLGITE